MFWKFLLKNEYILPKCGLSYFFFYAVITDLQVDEHYLPIIDTVSILSFIEDSSYLQYIYHLFVYTSYDI